MRKRTRTTIRSKTAVNGKRPKQPLVECAKTKKALARIINQENRLKHTQQIFAKTNHDLQERIKELNCLYAISKIVENQSNTLEDILQGTVDILPNAWQYPEATCSRIVLRDRTFTSRKFTETLWNQNQPIFVRGDEVGRLDIYYLEEKPEKDEGPFLKEERNLINVLTERIGAIVGRMEAQKALRESEAHNKALLGAIPDLMFQIDNNGKMLSFHAGKFVELEALFAALVGKNIFILSDEKKYLPRRILEQVMTHIRLAILTARTQIFEQHIHLGGMGWDFEIRIVLLQANEVLGIVQDITSRKRLEKEIIEISSREQRRIGHDLHDSLCQQLTGIGFLCKALETKIADKLPLEVSEAGEIVHHIDRAITLTRKFSRSLDPVGLETNGFIHAISELAVMNENFFGIPCQFDYTETVTIEDTDTAIHLYRIVQEALHNAMKHGNATRVVITLTTDGKTNTLSVTDNGRGIPETAHQCAGMGLSIMKYRASMIGASVEINNHADGGGIVACTFQSGTAR